MDSGAPVFCAEAGFLGAMMDAQEEVERVCFGAGQEAFTFKVRGYDGGVILEVVEGSNLISVAMPAASAVRLAEMLRGKAEGGSAHPSR